jgi:hypothetical protein
MSGSATVAADPDALLRYAATGADLARRTAFEANRLFDLTRSSTGGGATPLGASLGQLAGSRIPSLSRALQSSADLAGEVAVRLRRADAAAGARPDVTFPLRARGLAGQPIAGPAGVPIGGPASEGFDVEAWRAALSDAAVRAVAVARGMLSVAPRLGQLMAEVPALAPLSRLIEGPFGRIAPAAGLLVVGQDIIELFQYGDPREAWRREGLGYAREVARTLNDASLVALATAPSPPTLALAVGSGLVWLDLVCLDNGWPVPLPPPFPTFPGDLDGHLRALDDSRALVLPLATEGLRSLRDMATHGRDEAAGAARAFRSHDLIEGGRRSIHAAADLTMEGTQLVNDLATTGMRALLSL